MSDKSVSIAYETL